MKMKTWFSSDTHFGHDNIRKYANRPFKTLLDMDTKLISNFNERIKPDDQVFFLGDFCFRNTKGGKVGEGTTHNAQFYQKMLNGHWTFIRGNHDNNNSLNTKIESVVINFGGGEIFLCHKPHDANPDYKINLVGHVHELWKFKKLTNKSYMINVGVDVWKYMPISYDEIMKEFNKWLKNDQ